MIIWLFIILNTDQSLSLSVLIPFSTVLIQIEDVDGDIQLEKKMFYGHVHVYLFSKGGNLVYFVCYIV